MWITNAVKKFWYYITNKRELELIYHELKMIRKIIEMEHLKNVKGLYVATPIKPIKEVGRQ
jgi:hypothetical protein